MKKPVELLKRATRFINAVRWREIRIVKNQHCPVAPENLEMEGTFVISA